MPSLSLALRMTNDATHGSVNDRQKGKMRCANPRISPLFFSVHFSDFWNLTRRYIEPIGAKAARFRLVSLATQLSQVGLRVEKNFLHK